MDPVDIRKILLDVPIPKKEEEGARALVIEKIPSVAPMLKDLRGETSEYIFREKTLL